MATDFVSILKNRWIAKRNEFINAARKGKPIRGFFDGPDGYARRELRAYRLALGWTRDRLLPGQWFWARRDTRWDVYPFEPQTELIRVVPDGPVFVKMFHADGCKTIVSYFPVRPAA